MRPGTLSIGVFAAFLFFLSGCSPAHKPGTSLREGSWRMEMDVRSKMDPHAVILPFLFDLARDSGVWHARIHNGDEVILVDDVLLTNDSVHIRMPLFDSEFFGAIENDSVFSGDWHNYLKGPEYKIPFVAHFGEHSRFGGAELVGADVSGQWECHFALDSKEPYAALGIFHDTSGRVTGTFGTETGDYRYLDGAMHGDSLMLSAFDGSHAFLICAQFRNDSLIGRFRSGIHSQEPWVAVRNASFHLRDPDSLTFLREGYNMVDFRFPGLDGDTISPLDDRFRGHAMMVQVMGSWCPNCMDETLLLDQMYSTYHDRGLDVIAVAFERNPDKAQAINALKRFKEKLHVKYDIVYAGDASKEVASAKLPFLDHVLSYPTCIFIDRAGKVRRIRTGFYGPGTGTHYENYARNLKVFLEQMLNEPAPAAPKAAV